MLRVQPVFFELVDRLHPTEEWMVAADARTPQVNVRVGQRLGQFPPQVSQQIRFFVDGSINCSQRLRLRLRQEILFISIGHFDHFGNCVCLKFHLFI